jgi:hypothetical protein
MVTLHSTPMHPLPDTRRRPCTTHHQCITDPLSVWAYTEVGAADTIIGLEAMATGAQECGHTPVIQARTQGEVGADVTMMCLRTASFPET